MRLLAAEHWKIQPEFVEAAPEPSEMLKQADAALVIGDPALRIALKMEALAGKSPSGEQCCQGDPDDMPVPGFETLFVYDVAYQWREMTGKPCVLAIWAGRRDVDHAGNRGRFPGFEGIRAGAYPRNLARRPP